VSEAGAASGDPAVQDESPALQLSRISKRFGGQQALTDASLTLQRGEVHCLLGQNGSGKSTLIKILAGVEVPDTGGQYFIDGTKMDFGNPNEVRRLGLRFVHQDLALIEKLSVTDNLALGSSYVGTKWISSRREDRTAQKTLERYGITDIPASMKVSRLGLSQRTMTAIVRAMSQDETPLVLVCDEPTAALSEREKETLFELLRLLKSQGVAILYVTHRLSEVFQIGDRVTVLRGGRNVASELVASLDHDKLVSTILGREPETFYPTPMPSGLDSVLEIDGLAGGHLHDVSLDVHAGEIVGVCGLMGSGADDVLPLVFGATPRTGGTVKRPGLAQNLRTPSECTQAKIAYVPSDRNRLGSFVNWSVAKNMTICAIPTFLGRVSRRRERAETTRLIDQFGVMPRDPHGRVGNLSGGNAQKVVVARTQHSGAEVVLLEDPTAGVDVGAKPAIYSALNEIARGGGAILLMTSDFEEASKICDRVVVIANGRAVVWLSGSALSPDAILSAAIHTPNPTTEKTRA
jgi:ribose transport system ATP-binding protein